MEGLKQIYLLDRKYFLVFMAFLMYTTLPAQVTIKERAVIKPDKLPKLQSSHRLTVTMNAAGVYAFDPDNPSEPLNSALIVKKTSAECPEDQEASLAGSSASISLDATSGIYEINAIFRAPSINASINISLDGATIIDKAFDDNHVYDPIFITLYSDLNLGIDADSYATMRYGNDKYESGIDVVVF
jgi:hypothetical protein